MSHKYLDYHEPGSTRDEILSVIITALNDGAILKNHENENHTFTPLLVYESEPNNGWFVPYPYIKDLVDQAIIEWFPDPIH